MVQLIDIIKLRLNSKIKKFSYSFICGKGYSPPSGKNSFLSTVCGGFLSPIKKVPHACRHMTLSGAPTAIRTRGLSLRSGKKRSPLMPLATLGVPCFTGFLTFPSVHISVQIPRFSPGEISRVLAQLIFLWGQKTSRIHY